MRVDKPVVDSAATATMEWGSDYLAELLRRLDLKYLALNPGASLRGLHDSLVNYAGNTEPTTLLCLHEEHAVAIAHGYAKVTGKPMGVAVHSNVGVLHASMAVYNAWCDRVPMIIFGATGPVDAAQRRPWIDWIHTARDQGSLLRDFIKWDDQPASLGAAAESVMRASLIAKTAPRGPVYLCFDVSLQEDAIDGAPPALPDPAQFAVPAPNYPDPKAVRRAAELLAKAQRPVILAGRLNIQEPEAWQQRIALAERLNAAVLTDLDRPAAFPTDHRLHIPINVGKQGKELLRGADVILSLDWLDPAGAMRTAGAMDPTQRAFIQCSPEQYATGGATMDTQALQAAREHFLCEPEALVEALLELDGREHLFTAQAQAPEPAAPAPVLTIAPEAKLSVAIIAQLMREATRGIDVTLVRKPLAWNNTVWHYRHPLDFLGKDGGAGVGSGPGMAVGAALALMGTGRLPLAVIGDGDFMFSASAIWTAARYEIPLLIVVANNQSYFNDEVHQEQVARRRKRPVENKAVAQHLGDPDLDLAAIARAEGAWGQGPLKTAGEFDAAFREAVKQVQAGRVCVIDARVLPGYEG